MPSGRAGTGLVFTKPEGTGVPPQWVSREFGRLSRMAGLPPIRLHDPRHRYITADPSVARVPVKVLSERVGHANVGVTLGLHAHVLPGHDEAAAEGLARSVEGSGDKVVLFRERLPTALGNEVAGRHACGRGGIGRRAGFRSRSPQGGGGSSPLARTPPVGLLPAGRSVSSPAPGTSKPGGSTPLSDGTGHAPSPPGPRRTRRRPGSVPRG